MIGSKLKKLRTEKGLTQSELGKKASVSYIQIGRYEKNTSKPSSKVIKKLADALDVSTDYFLEDLETKKIGFKEIDPIYNELRTLIVDDNNEMLTLKNILETYVFKNQARRKFK